MVRRFRCALKGPTIHAEGTIHSYVPFSLVAPAGLPLLRTREVTDHWHQTMIPTLRRLKENMVPHGLDLLYIDNLSYHFLLDTLDYGKSIFRVMDFHDGFPGWKGEPRKLADKIAKKSHLTVYSALGLKNYVAGLTPRKAAFVPNGVDGDLFRQNHQARSRHPLLDNIPDPIVLYTGMIDSRIDFPLIRFAAKHLPYVSFVFTGTIQGLKKPKGLPKNIYFTGPIPHKELPLLMETAAGGMIPFDVNNAMGLIQGIRPLKLLEYMAAGLPVLSASWPELKKMNSPAWIYNDKNQFVDLVSKAVCSPYDPSESINFSLAHDWNQSFKLMLKAFI